MMLNVAICDDNKEIQENLKTFLLQYQFEKNIDFNIACFDDGFSLLADKNVRDFALVLLDVEMPGKNGLDTAKMLKQQYNKHINIIFISSYPQYMQNSFLVHPFYYMCKPVAYEDFRRILDSLIDEITDISNMVTLIKTDFSEEMIYISDIIFIEVSYDKRNELIFHTLNDDIAASGILSDWVKTLEPYGFCQCFRSILINIRHIHQITNKKLTLDIGTSLPLGRKYAPAIHAKLLNNVTDLKM
ncbi:MAG: LytTR family DNA-binding domain-containing protein [Clostridium sp.]|nr:LytTR family DNA-binding domain-containing protein [Clostridium sp.]